MRQPALWAASGGIRAGSPGGEASSVATTSTPSSVAGRVMLRSASARASMVVAKRSAVDVQMRKCGGALLPVSALAPDHSSSKRQAPQASARTSTNPPTRAARSPRGSSTAGTIRYEAWLRTSSAVPRSGRSAGARYRHRNGSGRSTWSRPPPGKVRRTVLPAASRVRTTSSRAAGNPQGGARRSGPNSRVMRRATPRGRAGSLPARG
jgi:hypothetical protein